MSLLPEWTGAVPGGEDDETAGEVHEHHPDSGERGLSDPGGDNKGEGRAEDGSVLLTDAVVRLPVSSAGVSSGEQVLATGGVRRVSPVSAGVWGGEGDSLEWPGSNRTALQLGGVQRNEP